MRAFWEFPGGKVAADEAPDQALRRELREELGIEVGYVHHFRRIEHDYPELQVAIDFYRVIDWQGNPAGCEGQRLKWVAKRALEQANLLPADIPVIQALNSPDE